MWPIIFSVFFLTKTTKTWTFHFQDPYGPRRQFFNNEKSQFLWDMWKGTGDYMYWYKHGMWPIILVGIFPIKMMGIIEIHFGHYVILYFSYLFGPLQLGALFIWFWMIGHLTDWLIGCSLMKHLHFCRFYNLQVTSLYYDESPLSLFILLYNVIYVICLIFKISEVDFFI